MKYTKKNICIVNKKVIMISLSALICISSVACTDNKKKDSQVGKATVERTEDFSDVRMAKIIGPQQAILKFTTANKASSIISLELKKVNNKFLYFLDGVTKTKENQILTIDASNGNIIKTENKGPLGKGNDKFIDFATTLDLKDAIEKATPYTKDANVNIVESYSFYNKDGKNLYKFNFTNAAENEKELIKKTIIIDAETGKEYIESKDNKNSKESNNTDTEDTKSKKSTPTGE